MVSSCCFREHPSHLLRNDIAASESHSPFPNPYLIGMTPSEQRARATAVLGKRWGSETDAGINFDHRFAMRQCPGLAPLLCLCTLLTVACFGVVAYADHTQGFLAQLLHGREVFERNCMACHGADGKGTGQLAAALPVKPADLTDCKLTDEDPVLMGQGIIRHGGPHIGRSLAMPAFGTLLSDSDIADVARYLRSLCADPDWVPRELDFPHPLITGKAFPEQHITLGGRFGRNGTNISEYMGTLDYRVNGRTSIGIMSRGLFIDPNIGPTESGLGDTVLSVNRVLAFSTQYRTSATANLGLTLPTGSDRRGLEDGAFVFEPGLRAGADWKQVVMQVAGGCGGSCGNVEWQVPGESRRGDRALFLPEPAFANHPNDRIQYGHRDIRIVFRQDEKRDSSSPSG